MTGSEIADILLRRFEARQMRRRVRLSGEIRLPGFCGSYSGGAALCCGISVTVIFFRTDRLRIA